MIRKSTARSPDWRDVVRSVGKLHYTEAKSDLSDRRVIFVALLLFPTLWCNFARLLYRSYVVQFKTAATTSTLLTILAAKLCNLC